MDDIHFVKIIDAETRLEEEDEGLFLKFLDVFLDTTRTTSFTAWTLTNASWCVARYYCY